MQWNKRNLAFGLKQIIVKGKAKKTKISKKKREMVDSLWSEFFQYRNGSQFNRFNLVLGSQRSNIKDAILSKNSSGSRNNFL